MLGGLVDEYFSWESWVSCGMMLVPRSCIQWASALGTVPASSLRGLGLVVGSIDNVLPCFSRGGRLSGVMLYVQALVSSLHSIL